MLLAPCYFMTLSARASTFDGIVRPICFAALRSMINFSGGECVSPVVNFAAEFSVPALFWLSRVNPFLRNQQSYSLGFLRRVVTKIPV
jgi:hypothetical protein